MAWQQRIFWLYPRYHLNACLHLSCSASLEETSCGSASQPIRQRNGWRARSPKPFRGMPLPYFLSAIMMAPMARYSGGGFAPWASATDLLRLDHPGRTAMWNERSARSGGSVSTMSSCATRRISGVSCAHTQTITIKRGPILAWTKIPPIVGRLSIVAASSRATSSADFTIDTAGYSFRNGQPTAGCCLAKFGSGARRSPFDICVNKATPPPFRIYQTSRRTRLASLVCLPVRNPLRRPRRRQNLAQHMSERPAPGRNFGAVGAKL